MPSKQGSKGSSKAGKIVRQAFPHPQSKTNRVAPTKSAGGKPNAGRPDTKSKQKHVY